MSGVGKDGGAAAMRPETTSEHIARDIREGRFPEQSPVQMVPVEAMTRDTDLIRRGDAISWCDKWIATFGAVEIRHTSAREYALDAVKDLRDALHSIPPHPVQEPPSPGVTAGATGDVIMQGLSDDTTELARFGHHPNPAIDFCIEVETLESRLHQAEHGLSKPGTEPETVGAVLADIQRAMDFRVGGDEGAVNAKHILRGLEARATPTPVVPADQRAAIEALADRMWRVHPKDLYDAGYEHLERGGKYDNPRAAWYADQIEALFKQFRDQVSPVVPAEGLDALLLDLHDLASDAYDNGKEHESNTMIRAYDAITALRSAAPVSGVTVRPLVWEDRPCGSYCWTQGLHYYTEGDDEDRDWYVSCMIDGIDVWQGENQPTRGECKALAQADYTSRILAALEVNGDE